MVLAAAGSTRRSGSRRRLVLGLVVAVALAMTLAAGYGLGYRLNLQTRSVPLPTATASPEEVVRTYTEAYDRRDFATMRAIYPSEQSASRFRAMGTMRDLQVTQSRSAARSDMSGMFPKAGHSYYWVKVTLDCTGLTGSDFSFGDGPNGWTYWLERGSASDPWTIIDHGNP